MACLDVRDCTFDRRGRNGGSTKFTERENQGREVDFRTIEPYTPTIAPEVLPLFWLPQPDTGASRAFRITDGVLAVPYLQCLRLTTDMTGSDRGDGWVSVKSGDQLLVKDGEDAIPPIFGGPSVCKARRAGLATHFRSCGVGEDCCANSNAIRLYLTRRDEVSQLFSVPPREFFFQ